MEALGHFPSVLTPVLALSQSRSPLRERDIFFAQKTLVFRSPFR